MQRRGQPGGLDYRRAPTGLEESQPVIPANLVCHADPLVKADEVRAATQQHMLAVVYYFASAGMLKG